MERHKKYDVIPIYLSQVPNYVNNNNDLTPLGEHLAAHEIGHFMVYNEGYGKMNINMLGMDPDALNNLGKDLANIVPLLLPGYFSGIFNFASHLIVNNRLAAYGYDASGEMYNVLYDKNINSLRETLSEQQMDAFGARYEINLRDNPDAARILFFEGTRMLSEMYLFLPQPYKGELLESVGEFWKNQVISLLKETETDLDRSRLYSPEFNKYYSPERYQQTIIKMFLWIGGKAEYVFPVAKPHDEYEKGLIRESKQCYENGDIISAYYKLCQVNDIDVSKEFEIVEDALWAEAFKNIGQRNTQAAASLILETLVGNGMADAAMILRERLEQLQKSK